MNEKSNVERVFIRDGYQPQNINQRGYQPTISQTIPKTTPTPPQKSGVPQKK